MVGNGPDGRSADRRVTHRSVRFYGVGTPEQRPNGELPRVVRRRRAPAQRRWPARADRPRGRRWSGGRRSLRRTPPVRRCLTGASRSRRCIRVPLPSAPSGVSRRHQVRFVRPRCEVWSRWWPGSSSATVNVSSLPPQSGMTSPTWRPRCAGSRWRSPRRDRGMKPLDPAREVPARPALAELHQPRPDGVRRRRQRERAVHHDVRRVDQPVTRQCRRPLGRGRPTHVTHRYVRHPWLLEQREIRT